MHKLSGEDGNVDDKREDNIEEQQPIDKYKGISDSINSDTIGLYTNKRYNTAIYSDDALETEKDNIKLGNSITNSNKLSDRSENNEYKDNDSKFIENGVSSEYNTELGIGDIPLIKNTTHTKNTLSKYNNMMVKNDYLNNEAKVKVIDELKTIKKGPDDISGYETNNELFNNKITSSDSEMIVKGELYKTNNDEFGRFQEMDLQKTDTIIDTKRAERLNQKKGNTYILDDLYINKDKDSSKSNNIELETSILGSNSKELKNEMIKKSMDGNIFVDNHLMKIMDSSSKSLEKLVANSIEGESNYLSLSKDYNVKNKAVKCRDANIESQKSSNWKDNFENNKSDMLKFQEKIGQKNKDEPENKNDNFNEIGNIILSENTLQKKKLKICNGSLYMNDLYRELLIKTESRIAKQVVYSDLGEDIEENNSQNTLFSEKQIINISDKDNVPLNHKIMKFSVENMPKNVNWDDVISLAYNEDYLSDHKYQLYIELNVDKNNSGKFYKESKSSELKSTELIVIDPSKISTIIYEKYNMEDSLKILKKELEIISDIIEEDPEDSIINQQTNLDRNYESLSKINIQDLTLIKNIFRSNRHDKNFKKLTFKKNLKYQLDNVIISTEVYKSLKSRIEHIENIFNLDSNFNLKNLIITEKSLLSRVKELQKMISYIPDEDNQLNDKELIKRNSSSVKNQYLDNLKYIGRNNKILNINIAMANSLLDSFTISHARKLDLKKMENLVKSRMSVAVSSSNRINTSINTKDDNYNVNTISSTNINDPNVETLDNKQMDEILTDLNINLHDKESPILFNIKDIINNIQLKEEFLKSYLNGLNSMNNWMQLYNNNVETLHICLNTLSKLNNIIEQGLQNIISLNNSEIE
ncbi:uncharacterized protein CMU_036550 [Cryptosporidium muris RN66]|uniref:Uncharacterized protein n=1 Tax=Cryptosporidium muris (strain RN66) TaxID=441375 RepID=B6AGZ0_CRYMR|nr:uncharacterized protein CMU_036550 [Cryptosporidium muris RN66]EEA07481.1 hypothetical protein CMU_036550 [Cryptosporidium muris RN66]|eukprot:XP_002141830.1 hypothetical protein [Cryptosporidium muris RN66]